MNNFKQNLSQYWNRIQGNLFTWLEKELPLLTQMQQKLVTILEVIRIEEHVFSYVRGFRGRPPKSRAAIARAFIAKAVYNIPITLTLIDRLKSDISLRRICGWENKNRIPHESLFSRAFKEFAELKLPQKIHDILIKKYSEKNFWGIFLEILLLL